MWKEGEALYRNDQLLRNSQKFLLTLKGGEDERPSRKEKKKRTSTRTGYKKSFEGERKCTFQLIRNQPSRIVKKEGSAYSNQLARKVRTGLPSKQQDSGSGKN